MKAKRYTSVVQYDTEPIRTWQRGPIRVRRTKPHRVKRRRWR